MTKKASQATGLLMSLGQEIQCNDKFLNDHCIPVIVQCLGEVVGPRVLKNYFILMFFIRQVCCIPTMVINYGYLGLYRVFSKNIL